MNVKSKVNPLMFSPLWTLLSLFGHAHSIDKNRTQENLEVIFVQPTLDGIAGNFHVPKAEHRYPSERDFNLILWQPNPNRADGELMPTSWSAGDMTGFYPSQSTVKSQLAFHDEAGASTVQIEGETVGAYLNSSDLSSTAGAAVADMGTMMVTPAFTPPRQKIIYPFAQSGIALLNSLELQIPVARDMNRDGNMTYANAVFVLEDRRSHTQISYEVNLFHHALRPGKPPTQEWLRRTEVGTYDVPSQSFQIVNPPAPDSRIVSALTGSALYQNQPWKGWRPFRFAITANNLTTAIQDIKEKYASFRGSENVADYGLVEWHLNAELKFHSGPAELGWSMRGALVALTPESSLSILH
jgi:hypothetical protein